MRPLGIVVLLAGLAGLLLTMGMDTTVGGVGAGGGRIHNLGLMSEKQNRMLLFAAVAIIGAVFAALGGRKQGTEPSAAGAATEGRVCPFCAETVKREAIVCRFCQRDLPPDRTGELQAEKAARAAAAEAAKPRGTCPNCSAIIALDSESCGACGAAFGAGAQWVVRPKAEAR